ncbi:MAG: hypothetical protein ABIJ34_01200 [archaeon]
MKTTMFDITPQELEITVQKFIAESKSPVGIEKEIDLRKFDSRLQTVILTRIGQYFEKENKEHYALAAYRRAKNSDALLVLGQKSWDIAIHERFNIWKAQNAVESFSAARATVKLEEIIDYPYSSIEIDFSPESIRIAAAVEYFKITGKNVDGVEAQLRAEKKYDCLLELYRKICDRHGLSELLELTIVDGNRDLAYDIVRAMKIRLSNNDLEHLGDAMYMRALESSDMQERASYLREAHISYFQSGLFGNTIKYWPTKGRRAKLTMVGIAFIESYQTTKDPQLLTKAYHCVSETKDRESLAKLAVMFGALGPDFANYAESCKNILLK